MQIAEPANHVFRSAHFQQPSANFVRTGSNSFDDRRERNAVCAKFVWVHVDLILANKSANGGYLGYSWNRFELVTQVPILKTAQVGQTALMAVVHERVFIDPTCAGRIRPDDRMNARGQATSNLLHVLQNPRARPIQVCPILEDDEDVRIPKHCLCAYRFHVRRGEKCSDYGISDLVFDKARRLASPRRVDNHFHVGNIRQRIVGSVTQCPDSCEYKQECSHENQETILCAPINPTRDHLTFLPWHLRSIAWSR